MARFNTRVLELAEDPSLPLLERARFLAIFASNLDEFFMVRVAGLKRRLAAGVAVQAASGLMPREVLEAIWRESRELMQRHGAASSATTSCPALAKRASSCSAGTSSTTTSRRPAEQPVHRADLPGADPARGRPRAPVPLHLGALAQPRGDRPRPGHRQGALRPGQGAADLARGSSSVGDQRFVPLEDVIAAHLDQLFPGMEVLEHHTFRVTRNEDLEVEEDDAENLLQGAGEELQRRRFGPPVRLEVEETIDPHVLELLVSELEVSRRRGLPPARSARPHRPARRSPTSTAPS